MAATKFGPSDQPYARRAPADASAPEDGQGENLRPAFDLAERTGRPGPEIDAVEHAVRRYPRRVVPAVVGVDREAGQRTDVEPERTDRREEAVVGRILECKHVALRVHHEELRVLRARDVV